ncbi:MAG TPA: alpha/beta hydrolase [Streptosporangiaceae bacterium]|jgi:pimeloyl-ACP methyl ester carboxylesterase|nr:alpha/beta hydrolase [Streptosporangiaceae bacterium]
MPSWRRVTGVAGLAAGAVVAAGTGAVIAAEKVAVGRLRLRPDPEADEPFGQLRGQPLTVLADDGVALHVEINGPDDAPVTIIFCHGYALSQDVWHYQRRDLAAAERLVFWDQRDHGKSGASPADHATIGQLGADLYAVLTAVAPGKMPVVLVGHSMGGMTIMALAREHPELFGPKVIGAVLISTAAGGVDPTVWIPVMLRPIARQAAGPVLRGVSSGVRAAVVERVRQAGGDLAFLGTRFVAFGDPAASPAVVDFLERIIRATPVGVVAAFYLALLSHDERASLGVLGRVPVTVVAAEQDRLVPLEHSDELAEQIPGAELVRVPGAGHAVILERPDLINRVISDLVARATSPDVPRASTA